MLGFKKLVFAQPVAVSNKQIPPYMGQKAILSKHELVQRCPYGQRWDAYL